MSDPMRSITLLLTSRCNQRCRYCYQAHPDDDNDLRDRQRPNQPAGGQGREQELDMSREVLRACLDWALAQAGPRLQVIFSGGEPLLAFRRIREAVEHVAQACPDSTQVTYRILTNGLLLTDSVQDFLVEHRINTQVSWDGVSLAQHQRKEGTHRILQERMGRLKERHPRHFSKRLTVAMTLLPETVPMLTDSVAHLVSQGVRHLLIAPVMTHHESWRTGDLEVLDREFGKVHDLMKDHLARTDEVPLLLFRKWDIDLKRVMPRQNIPQCDVGDLRSPAFDSAGQLWGCGVFAGLSGATASRPEKQVREIMRFGWPGEENFAERQAGFGSTLADLPLFTAKEKRYSAYGKCEDCSYRGSCSVCPLALIRHARGADPLRVPDFMCAFNQVTRKYRDKFPPLNPAQAAKAS